MKETTEKPSSSNSSKAQNFIPLIPTTSPGYPTGAAHQGLYPMHQPHQGYDTFTDPYSVLYITPADLSDLTALDYDLNTEKDNSDLEVLYVMQPNTRKPRRVQVVKLTDSSDENIDAVNSRANTDASIHHKLSRQAQNLLPHSFPPDPAQEHFESGQIYAPLTS